MYFRTELILVLWRMYFSLLRSVRMVVGFLLISSPSRGDLPAVREGSSEEVLLRVGNVQRDGDDVQTVDSISVPCFDLLYAFPLLLEKCV